MTSLTLTVNGMSCMHCVNTVERALEELGASATVDLAAGRVTASYEEANLSEDRIRQAIEEQGYAVE